MPRGRKCPWCDGTGRFVAAVLDRGFRERVVPCKHPPRVVVRPLPGAMFRTTKLKPAETAKGRRAAAKYRKAAR